MCVCLLCFSFHFPSLANNFNLYNHFQSASFKMGQMWSKDDPTTKGGKPNVDASKKPNTSSVKRDKIKCIKKSDHLMRCSFQLEAAEFSKMERSGQVAADQGIPMVYVGIGVAVLVLVVLIAAFAFIWHRMKSGNHGGYSKGSFKKHSGMKSHGKSSKSKVGSKKSGSHKSKKSTKKSHKSKKSKSRKSSKK